MTEIIRIFLNKIGRSLAKSSWSVESDRADTRIVLGSRSRFRPSPILDFPAMKSRPLLIVASMLASCLAIGNASAQDLGPADPIDVSALFASMDTEPSPSSASDLRDTQRSASEIRQTRALYQANQRMARLERNRWLGLEPLRPNWSATPMTTSHHTPRNTYFVPVYVYGR